MKTTFYVIAIIAFSALMLSPKMPKDYPPKIVLEQRKEIVCKEKKIELLIDKIESQLVKDSVYLKQNN
jgi:hypothetical protein